jgi:predicted exporter/SAM-dependent methyltransferase
MKSGSFNILLFSLTVCGIAILLGLSFILTDIDMDITRYLPRNDAVLEDAVYIFDHHPIQSEMVVDIGVETPDPDRLAKAADWVEARMRRSGLFSRVGTESVQNLIPELINHIVDNLPVMFTRRELDTQVLPLLAPERIARRLEALQAQLLNLDAIGQAALISTDPLGIRNTVMDKLAHLAPAKNVEIYKGKLLSTDKRHLLIIATPAASATDTGLARQISNLMAAMSADLAAMQESWGTIRLTPMGAYRAALDNEYIARRDVQKAIFLATLGIALLLIFAFPRPLIGLFAFLPAVAGTVGAFFVLSVIHDKISIMALGFGGAIISITIDHGIACLLFLDRSSISYGKQASSEIRAIGLMAALTTIGAFASLSLSGFPVFVQLGQFTALGIAFSFLFVHSVFPRIFPRLPPAKLRSLPFRRMVARLPIAGKRAALVALLIFCVLFFFAKPEFNVSLSTMNTVGSATRASEQLMKSVWGGGIFSRIYLLTEGRNGQTLQDAGDDLLLHVEQDLQNERLSSGFVGSMIFPGKVRSQENFKSWQAFWTPNRIQQIRQAFSQASRLGFTDDAFAPFFNVVSSNQASAGASQVPEKFYPLVGMEKRDDGALMQFSTLTPGPDYSAAKLHQRYSTLARIFDPAYFSQRLGKLLFSSFLKMLAIIGASVAVLLFFFFLNIRLTVICLTPVLFALVCTLGSLKLIGHALDIPALMLAIIVLGMGIDYALFLVRAYQRYGGTDHPSFERIKLAVIMASMSTLIGFGVLCTAEHALLRSAGITSLLGIGYSLIGAFVLLPPLLRHHFASGKIEAHRSRPLRGRVLDRYRTLEAYPRMVARYKLKSDPMFDELGDLLEGTGELKTVLDIGCGYGVPACWLLEQYPDVHIYASDSDPEKMRAAALAFGDRGQAICAMTPSIPEPPVRADAALLLNIVQLLDEPILVLTLERLHAALRPQGRLIVRVPVREAQARSGWNRALDRLIDRIAGRPPYLRSQDALDHLIRQSGFRIEKTHISERRKNLFWVVATSLQD